jgi:hypothetical protein
MHSQANARPMMVETCESPDNLLIW